VLAPEIGEIIGGSQREERLAVLDAHMAECQIDRELYAPSLPASPRRQRGLDLLDAPKVFGGMRFTFEDEGFGHPSRATSRSVCSTVNGDRGVDARRRN
jgi:hypothetical protein